MHVILLCSQLCTIPVVLIIILVLLFIAPLFYHLPKVSKHKTTVHSGAGVWNAKEKTLADGIAFVRANEGRMSRWGSNKGEVRGYIVK